ncbi:hypothetical protein DFJ74DRAFT_418995 [Hyaloraphidium curvatum]|nr:hypothetical protein DFJ74DRAFT_418995 [Hyaloraphidium curvatum]
MSFVGNRPLCLPRSTATQRLLTEPASLSAGPFPFPSALPLRPSGKRGAESIFCPYFATVPVSPRHDSGHTAGFTDSTAPLSTASDAHRAPNTATTAVSTRGGSIPPDSRRIAAPRRSLGAVLIISALAAGDPRWPTLLQTDLRPSQTADYEPAPCCLPIPSFPGKFGAASLRSGNDLPNNTSSTPLVPHISGTFRPGRGEKGGRSSIECEAGRVPVSGRFQAKRGATGIRLSGRSCGGAGGEIPSP